MLNIRCPKKSPTSLRWVSAKLLQILENLHSRQDKCFSSVLNSSYSLFFSSCFILSFFSSILHYTLAPIFFFYVPLSLGTFLRFPHYTTVRLFFLSLQFLLSSLLPFVPLSYTSLNPASLSPLTFLCFPLCFLHSPPGGSHFRWVRLWWWPCPKDRHGGTHTHTHTHTHIHTLTLTLYVCRKVCVFTTKLDSFWLQQLGNDSDLQNVTILVWAENMNYFICNKQCCHTAF